jgi:multicomponent Na+:H+ antiporter subunit B
LDFVNAAGEAVGGVFGVGLQILFWITIVFVFLERSDEVPYQAQTGSKAWTVAQLPKLPHKRQISLGEALTDIVPLRHRDQGRGVGKMALPLLLVRALVLLAAHAHKRYGRHLLEAVKKHFDPEVLPGPWPDAPMGRTRREVVARRKGLPILRVIAKILIPFILLFALYVQFHGDYGPGGGFQAGVIIAAAIIFYGIIYGLETTRKVVPSWLVETMLAQPGCPLLAAVPLAMPWCPHVLWGRQRTACGTNSPPRPPGSILSQ